MKRTIAVPIKKVAVVAILLAGVALYLHKDIDDKAGFVTSEACRECHQLHYQSWQETLHPHQFRPIRGPEDVLGDFESDDPALTFGKNEVQFVIGNRWEQVYATKIDGEYYPLPAKWYIAKKEWVPYKVDTWRKTPLSTQCNGCHTTGFDPDTFEFTEYGIGCEACHGPGSLHVQNLLVKTRPWCTVCHTEEVDEPGDDIIVSVKAAVCGQCHSRGKQRFRKAGSDHIQNTFNFPVDYRPGENISDAYEPMTAEKDKKGKYWWTADLSKNRHQEYADFTRSKHAKALENLKESHAPQQGELTQACLHCHSTDYRLASPEDKPGLETAKYGITCVVCHEPHGLDRYLQIAEAGPHRCGECHIGSLSVSSGRKARPHFPCSPNEVKCADCHMPRIVKSGGLFPIRSHAFKIVPPEASKELGMPSSCQNGGCHRDKDVEWAIRAFRDHYPEAG